MKAVYAAVGAVTLLMAGPASAAVIFDTITGQTENSGVRDALRPIVSGNRGPIGTSFTAANDEVMTSVTLRVRNVDTVPDGGSVWVYLVPNTGSGASSLPTATGTILSGAILLGNILDNAVPALGNSTSPTPAGAFNNITLSTSVSLLAGTTYWVEMVDGPVPSSLKWGINSAVGALGVSASPNTIFSTSDPTDTTLIAYNAGNNPNNALGEIFEMQINATLPEPTSMALLSAGLLGLGLSRRRSKKLAG